MNVSGRTVAVVGMAKSGLAATALLREHGAMVRGVDSNASAAGTDVVPQNAAAFDGVDLVVISPGVPADLELLTSLRVPVIGELELAGYWLRGPVIGITGSNGKTTTTALIGEILRHSGIPAQVGGNIGRPPTDMVATSRPDQWNVL